MNLRKALAGLAVAGTLALGIGGVASAATPAPGSTTTPHSFSCDTAKDHLTKVHTRVEAIKAHITKVEARIDQLRKDGQAARADALAKRLETIKDRLVKAEARVEVLTKRISERCGDPKAVTPAT